MKIKEIGLIAMLLKENNLSFRGYLAGCFVTKGYNRKFRYSVSKYALNSVLVAAAMLINVIDLKAVPVTVQNFEPGTIVISNSSNEYIEINADSWSYFTFSNPNPTAIGENLPATHEGPVDVNNDPVLLREPINVKLQGVNMSGTIDNYESLLYGRHTAGIFVNMNEQTNLPDSPENMSLFTPEINLKVDKDSRIDVTINYNGEENDSVSSRYHGILISNELEGTYNPIDTKINVDFDGFIKLSGTKRLGTKIIASDVSNDFFDLNVSGFTVAAIPGYFENSNVVLSSTVKIGEHAHIEVVANEGRALAGVAIDNFNSSIETAAGSTVKVGGANVVGVVGLNTFNSLAKSWYPVQNWVRKMVITSRGNVDVEGKSNVYALKVDNLISKSDMALMKSLKDNDNTKQISTISEINVLDGVVHAFSKDGTRIFGALVQGGEATVRVRNKSQVVVSGGNDVYGVLSQSLRNDTFAEIGEQAIIDVTATAADGKAIGVQTLNGVGMNSQLSALSSDLTKQSVTVLSLEGSAVGLNSRTSSTNELTDDEGEKLYYTPLSAGKAIINANANIVATGKHAIGLLAQSQGGSVHIATNGGTVIADGSVNSVGMQAELQNLWQTQLMSEVGFVESHTQYQVDNMKKAPNQLASMTVASKVMADGVDGVGAKFDYTIVKTQDNTDVSADYGPNVRDPGRNADGSISKVYSGGAAYQLTTISGSEIKGGSGNGAGVLMTREKDANGNNVKLYQTDDRTTYEIDAKIDNGGIISSENDHAIVVDNLGGTFEASNSGTIIGQTYVHGMSQSSFINNGKIIFRGDRSISDFGSDLSTSSFANKGMISVENVQIYHSTRDSDFNISTTDQQIRVGSFSNESGGVLDLRDQTEKNISDQIIGNVLQIGRTFDESGKPDSGLFVSDGGALIVNASIQPQGGLADRLQVFNAQTGTGGATRVFVKADPNRSLRGPTIDRGVEVISVLNKSSADAFKLAAPVYNGFDEYQLAQGGNKNRTAENAVYYGNAGQSWYLYALREDDKLVTPTPDGTESQPDKAKPGMTPTIGGYLGNLRSVSMFDHQLRTRQPHENIVVDRIAGESQPLWFRTQIFTERYTIGNDAIKNHDQTQLVQAGGDFGVIETKNKGDLHYGFVAGYGEFKNTSTSLVSHNDINSEVKGWNIGLYGTWYQNPDNDKGLYVDVWTQYSGFDNDLDGEGVNGKTSYDSSAWTSSAEVGYSHLIGSLRNHEYYIVPQAQVIYRMVDSDTFWDGNGLRVDDVDADGFISRVGARFNMRDVVASSGWQPWIEANWIHDGSDDTIRFKDRSGQIMHVDNGDLDNLYEVRVGFQTVIRDKVTASMELGGRWGDDRYRRANGQFNLSYRW